MSSLPFKLTPISDERKRFHHNWLVERRLDLELSKTAGEGYSADCQNLPGDCGCNEEQVCEPKAYQITKETADVVTETGKIEFKEWGECSYEKQDEKIIVICDSKTDGDNDGICKSGESCVKFVISQNDVKRYVKNSKDEFTEDDKSFYLKKLDYEVEK